MQDQIKHLGRLSEIDERIHTIRRNQSDVPPRIEELRGQIAAEQELINEKIASRDEMIRQSKSLEIGLADLDAKISRDRDKEMQVRTTEELHALQKEVRATKKKKDEIEEKVLGLMDEAGEIDKEIARAEKRLAEFTEKTNEEIAALEILIANAEEEIAKERAVRDEITPNLTADALDQYEHLHDRKIFPAVVRVVDGICTGCHSRLQPQLYNQVIAGADIYSCPTCYRLLYYQEDDE